MGKMYRKLLPCFLLLLISMAFYASAYPEGAGTCNVEEMSQGSHGKSNLKSPGGYKLNLAKQLTGDFEITLEGTGNFMGVLVYVVDGSKKRIGEFVNLPANIQIKKDCDASTTVTHSNPSTKNFPFKLTWKAPPSVSGDLTVKSLVVKSFKEWAILDNVQFNSATGAVSAPANGGGNQDNTPAEPSFLEKYLLFIIMIGITTLLYIVGSVTEAMLKRQQVKSRSYAKTIQNIEGSR